MPDNPFEKRVQHTLDEFHLVPTDKVWNTVEAGLRKDRRRRVIVFWLPMAVLLTAGLGYWMLTRETSPEKNVTYTERQTPASVSSSATDNDKLSSSTQEPATSTPANEAKVYPKSQIESETAENVISEQNKSVASRPSKTTVLVDTKTGLVQKKSASRINTITSAEPMVQVPAQETAVIAEATLAPLTAKGPDFSWAPVSLLYRNSIHPTGTTPLSLAASETTTVFSAPKKKANTGRWTFGVTAGISASGVTDGGLFSLLQKSAVMDASTVSNNTGSTAIPPPVASTLQSRFSFSIGGVARFQVSERVSLLAGLQYQQFHTSFAAGFRIDSPAIVSNYRNTGVTIGQFYSSGKSSTYRNRYHFLELPVTLQWKLGKRSPLQWEGGFAIGQLIGTNALHFDGSTGIYYSDNSLFRKTQLSMHTGVSLRLAQGKYPVELAPQLQYNISSLLTPGGDPAYLWNVGLRVRVFGK